MSSENGAAGAAKPKYQNAVVVGLVLLLVGLSIALAQYKASSLLTTLAEYFTLSGSMASWIMSIFTFVGIFLAFPAGGAIEKFGFKKTMIVSSGLIVVGGLIGVAAYGTINGIVLIASRAVEGIALTFITTAAPVAINKCVDPKNVGLATGLWGCWGNGGAVLAGVLTPQVFEMAGFNGVWIGYAIAAAVVAVIFAVVIREPKGEAPIAEQIEEAAAPVEAPVKMGFKDLLTKDVILFQLSFAIFNIIMLALLGLLPTVLQLPVKGFSLSASSMASIVPSLLALISCPVGGIIADKLGKTKPILLITFTVLGPCLAVMYIFTGVPFWIAAVILGLVGFASTGLLINGWLQIIPHPSLVAKGMGLLTFVQCVGQFLGTFFIQILLGSDYSNFVFAGVVLCCLGLCGVVCLVFTKMK